MPIDPNSIKWDSIDPNAVKWDEPVKKSIAWSDVASGAASNMVPSLGRMASGIFEAVTSPVKTAKSVLDLGAGALQNVLPESLVQAVGEDKSSRNVAGSGMRRLANIALCFASGSHGRCGALW